MPILEELTTWITENEGTINDVLGGAVEGVGAIFNGFADAIKFVITNFEILKPLIYGVTAAIITQQIISWINGLYAAWTTATKTQTAAQVLLNIAVKANPFGVAATVIGLLIAAGMLLVQHWGVVKNAALVAWGGIKTALFSVWNFLSSVVTGIYNGISNVILGSWNGIKSAATNIWGGIKSVVTGAFNGIVTFFESAVGTVKTIFTTMGDGIAAAFKFAFEAVKIPINGLITMLNLVAHGIETLLNLAAKAINAIPDISIPSWVPVFGGSTFGIPDLPTVDIPDIPKLAEGGTITRKGTVMVGEEGPEFLDLPRGAKVTPLDKVKSESIVINVNNPTIFNERDAEKLGDLLVRYLKMKGIQPRGV
jgi:phage-related protein